MLWLPIGPPVGVPLAIRWLPVGSPVGVPLAPEVRKVPKMELKVPFSGIWNSGTFFKWNFFLIVELFFHKSWFFIQKRMSTFIFMKLQIAWSSFVCFCS